jgi:hypothetical protein
MPSHETREHPADGELLAEEHEMPQRRGRRGTGGTAGGVREEGE